MSDQPDFDVQIDTAWDDFESRLAIHALSMNPGDELMISSVLGSADDETELPACVRIVHLGDGVLRSEIPPSRLMHPVRLYFQEDFELLAELGWAEPTRCSHQDPGPGSWHHLDMPQSESKELVARTVSAFRQFWSVTHPSFLTAESSGNPTSRVFDAYPQFAVFAEHDPQLQSDVDDALESFLGERPVKDEDGDIRLAFDHGCAYIRVAENTVQIIATITGQVDPAGRAGSALGILDRQWPTLKFLLEEEFMVAESRVDCSPFSTEHLLRAVSTFQYFLESVDAEFIDRVNDAEIPLPPELLTLLYLDPNSTGTLDNSEVAYICHDDRDLILELLRLCSAQELEWRGEIDSAAEDDADLAAYTGEAESWAQTTECLRSALRYVVLNQRER